MKLLRVYPALLRVGLADAVAYRAEMIVWMLSMTMPLVSLALWTAVAGGAKVGRFGAPDFVAYFLGTLVVRQLTGSWVVWEMNQDIKSGTLSRRLLKPLHPLIAYSAENLAAVPIRAMLAAPLAIVLLATSATTHLPSDPILLGVFLASLGGAWVITFSTMALIGALGFFLESSASLFEVWLVAFTVLSGYLLPLELFPPWVGGLAAVLPFRYALAFPVETLVGLLTREEALRQLVIQVAFASGTLVAALLVWRRGVRRYGAYGG